MPRLEGKSILFRLIHSLTKEEKSFIKKNTKNKTLIKLFNHVNSQKISDEKSLKETFKYYPVLKQRLFELIVKHLYVLHKDKNQRYMLMYQFVASDILYKKGLRGRAVEIIKKSVSIANKEEDFAMQNILIRQQWSLTHQTWGHQQLKTKVREYFSDLEEIKKKESVSDRLLKENIKMGLQLLSSWYLDPNIAILNEPIDLELLHNSQVKNLSATFERRRLITLGMYYSFHNQHVEAYKLYSKVFRIDENNLRSRKVPYAFEMYINSLRLSLSTCKITSKMAEMEKIFLRFLKQQWRTENEILIARLITIITEAALLWAKGKHAEGEKYILSVQKEFEETIKLTLAQPYYFDFAGYQILFHFSNNNYKQAFLTLNAIQIKNLKNSAPKFYKDIELFRVLMQLQAKNYDLARTFIKNLLRRKLQLKLSDLEKSFLLLIKNVNLKNHIKLYQEAQRLLRNNDDAIVVFSIMDVKDWLMSSLNARPLSEIIAQKTEHQ